MKFIDEVLRHQHAATKDEDERRWHNLLRSAQFFDINNVIPLLPEYGNFDSFHKIPIRPPFPSTWAEHKRTVHANGHEFIFLTGTHFIELDAFERDGPLAGDVAGIFCSITYIRITSTTQPEFQHIINQLWTIMNYLFIKVDEQGFLIGTNSEKRPQLFGLGELGVGQADSSDLNIFEVAWEPLMAFGLLHCKNITTDLIAPPPKLQKATVKRGHLPLVSYKMLRVSVSDRMRKQYGNPDDPQFTENRRNAPRFHLVRGHFKHLQHSRYTEPGWYWWPQHWRGNPEVGTVLKDYTLVAHEG